MCYWLKWPGKVLHIIPFNQSSQKEEKQEIPGYMDNSSQPHHRCLHSKWSPQASFFPSHRFFAIKLKFNPECHCKLFIKTQSNGQWKTSWFFTFWWEWGGARKGQGQMETAQKERQLYPPLLLPWPARFRAPQVHLTVLLLLSTYCGYRQRVGLASAGRGWKIRVEAIRATKIWHFFSNTWYQESSQA